MDNEIIKYPKEALCFISKTKEGRKAFAVKPEFFTSENRPMRIFDEAFSRIVFSLGHGGHSVMANLSIDDVPTFLSKLKICCEDYHKRQFGLFETASSSKEQPNSPAFTEKFTAGTLKGKTPAEVLATMSNGKEVLNEQYVFLAKNAKQYPKNKVLMEAIEAASKLTPEEAAAYKPSVSAVTVHEIGCRPLRSKGTTEDGMTFIYECKLQYFPNNTYPFNITIKNYYAFVEKTEDGLLNVNMSKGTKKVFEDSDSGSQNIKNYFLSIENADALYKWLEWLTSAFTIYNFGKQSKLSNDLFNQMKESN